MPFEEAQYIDRSFLSRFGAVILSGGIASIPIALFTYQGELNLTPQQVWFISKVLSYKWGSGLPYPSIKKMADETKVSRQHLHNYQKQLVEAGWLKVINRRNAQGGKDSNLFDFSPLFQALEELLQRDHPENDQGSASPGLAQLQGGGGNSTPHVNHSLHTHVKSGLHPYVNSSLHEVEEEEVEPPQVEETFISKENGASSHNLRQSRSEPTTQPSGGPTRVGELLPPARAQISNRGRPPKATPAIAHYMTDLSSIHLHDEEHTKSNITHAMRIFRASGKSETDFISVMLEAKAITLDWAGNIHKEAGKPGIKNRAPYFFAVLEDLLGMKHKQSMEISTGSSMDISLDEKVVSPQFDWDDIATDETPSIQANISDTSEVSELDTLWQKVLIELAAQMTPTNFSAWLRETRLIELDKNKAVVAVPTQFQQEHLKLRFAGIINKTFSSVQGTRISTGFVTLSDIKY
jgi:hypothetical protein